MVKLVVHKLRVILLIMGTINIIYLKILLGWYKRGLYEKYFGNYFGVLVGYAVGNACV
jgi:hypothetical protein